MFLSMNSLSPLRSWGGRALSLASFVALLATGAIGCGSSATIESYTPEGSAAKKALEATLNAWKDGKRPDAIEFEGGAANPLDAEWRDGKKLKDYKVLGEAAAPNAGEAAVKFQVQLTLDGSSPKEVAYFVVGAKTMLVARDKDFEALSGVGNVNAE